MKKERHIIRLTTHDYLTALKVSRFFAETPPRREADPKEVMTGLEGALTIILDHFDYSDYYESKLVRIFLEELGSGLIQVWSSLTRSYLEFTYDSQEDSLLVQSGFRSPMKYFHRRDQGNPF